MADMQIKFNCGCGFLTYSASDADDHAEKTGHRMECHGTIVPQTQKMPRAKPVVLRTSGGKDIA